MKAKAIRSLTIGIVAAVVAASVACGKSQAETAPSPNPGPAPSSGPSLAAPALASPVGGITISTLKPTLAATNAAATGNVGAVTYEFEVSEMDSFPANSRTSTSANIAQGSGQTTWQPPSDLMANFVYYWHARATNGTMTTDWSKTETFKTP